jgi:hypothetical protein
MRFNTKDVGMIKDMLKQMKVMDKRLKRVERVVPIETLTKADLREIEKSEGEIRKGKYRTIEQVKKELGIE